MCPSAPSLFLYILNKDKDSDNEKEVFLGSTTGGVFLGLNKHSKLLK